MKVIIKENELKPIIFRLFDHIKSQYGHPVLDFNTFGYLGLPDGYYDRQKYRELFIEYIRGVKVAQKLGDDILNKLKEKIQTVELDGSAGNIDFRIDSINSSGGDFEVNVTIVGGNISNENDELEDFFDFYEELGLGEVSEFEDYLRDEIRQYLTSQVFKRTGLHVYVDLLEVEYSDKITCKNCGWSWRENSSDPNDLYKCHKCGNDNNL